MTPIRCLDAICLDGPPEGDEPRPRWAKQGVICERCADLLEKRLAEMPARHDQLRSVLGGSRSAGGENRPTKGSPPIPLDLAVHDHLTEMHAVLVSWSLLVREERNLRGPDANAIDALSRWLLAQHDWIIGQGWVADLSQEMRDLSRTADAMTRVHPGWHPLDAPCPGCHGHGLGRWDGADEVACTDCGERWAEADYPRFVLVLATDPTYTVTAAQAAERVNLAPSTIRGWIAAERLLHVGVVAGVRRFAVGDVDRVAQECARDIPVSDCG